MCADHQRCDENAHEAANEKTADKDDQEQHPSLGLLQRREFLLDGASDLRLLGIGAVGRDHRERHAGVAEIGDRISSLPWKRERGRLHALPCLGREFRHQSVAHLGRCHLSVGFAAFSRANLAFLSFSISFINLCR